MQRGHCLADGCGAKVSKKWCTGPDGVATLCATCYGRFTAMRIPLFQNPKRPARFSVKAYPGWRKVIITGFAKKMTDGGVRRNLKIPYVVAAAETEGKMTVSQVLASSTGRSVDVARKKLRSCARCGVSSTPQWADGPDGVKTLCMACGARYRQRKCDLYENPEERSLTARAGEGKQELEVVGFRTVGGKVDLTRPIVQLARNNARGDLTAMRNDEVEVGSGEGLEMASGKCAEPGGDTLSISSRGKLRSTTRRHVSIKEREETEKLRRLEAERFYKEREELREEKRRKFEEQRKLWVINHFNIKNEAPSPEILQRMKDAGIPPMNWQARSTDAVEMSTNAADSGRNHLSSGNAELRDRPTRTRYETRAFNLAAPVRTIMRADSTDSDENTCTEAIREKHAEPGRLQTAVMQVRLHCHGVVVNREISYHTSFVQLSKIAEDIFHIDMRDYMFVHVDEEGVKMHLKDVADLLDIFENISSQPTALRNCVLHLKPRRKRLREK